MKPPITTAQAMQHPDVVTTINMLGQMADALRTRLAEVEKDAARYQWLTDDHPELETRKQLIDIAGRLWCMGKGAADAAIDAAMGVQS